MYSSASLSFLLTSVYRVIERVLRSLVWNWSGVRDIFAMTYSSQSSSPSFSQSRTSWLADSASLLFRQEWSSSLQFWHDWNCFYSNEKDIDVPATGKYMSVFPQVCHLTIWPVCWNSRIFRCVTAGRFNNVHTFISNRWVVMISNRVRKSSPLFPILSRMNPSPILICYFFNAHFSLLSLFWKNKGDVWAHLAVCVSTPILTRQRLDKRVSAASNTHATIEEFSELLDFWTLSIVRHSQN
jgi:hypothetical protein